MEAMLTLGGLSLIVVSGLLIWSQRRGRAAAPRQFRRRALTSLLMGLLGVSILTGQWIAAALSPIAFMLFWLAVLAMAGLLGVSGLVDLLVTRAKNRREIHGHQVELRRLQSELAKAEERRREHSHHTNGEAKRRGSTDGTQIP